MQEEVYLDNLGVPDDWNDSGDGADDGFDHAADADDVFDGPPAGRFCSFPCRSQSFLSCDV